MWHRFLLPKTVERLSLKQPPSILCLEPTHSAAHWHHSLLLNTIRLLSLKQSLSVLAEHTWPTKLHNGTSPCCFNTTEPPSWKQPPSLFVLGCCAHKAAVTTMPCCLTPSSLHVRSSSAQRCQPPPPALHFNPPTFKKPFCFQCPQVAPLTQQTAAVETPDSNSKGSSATSCATVAHTLPAHVSSGNEHQARLHACGELVGASSCACPLHMLHMMQAGLGPSRACKASLCPMLCTQQHSLCHNIVDKIRSCSKCLVIDLFTLLPHPDQSHNRGGLRMLCCSMMCRLLIWKGASRTCWSRLLLLMSTKVKQLRAWSS